MKYLLIYYTKSKYLHYIRRNEKEFNSIESIRSFLIENIKDIENYLIYKLTDLTSK